MRRGARRIIGHEKDKADDPLNMGVMASGNRGRPGYRAVLHLEPLNDRAQFEGYPVFDSLKPAPELAVLYARAPGKKK